MSTVAEPPAPATGAASQAAPWRVWAALAIVDLVWGSTYLAIRVMVETMPALLSAGIRFATAGLLVLGFLAIRRGAGAIRLTWREWGAAALIGTLLCGGGNGLVTIAEKDVPSALAALVIASVPLWVALLRGLLGDRVHRGTIAGVLVGFAGVALLLMPGNRPDGATTLGMVLLLVAALSWAIGSISSSRVGLPRDPFVSTGAQMLCGGLVEIVAGFAIGEGSELTPAAFSTDSLLAFAYLIVFGSIVAFTAYVWLLQNAPISKVATYAYVNPVVAVVLGWLILSEQISATTLIGAAVIVASVAMIVRRESRDNEPSTRPPRRVSVRSLGATDR